VQFTEGETVRVVRDHYKDHGRSFVGKVGRVAGVADTYVTVAGLAGPDEPDALYGFDPDELDHA
jgi:hypothetical protein